MKKSHKIFLYYIGFITLFFVMLYFHIFQLSLEIVNKAIVLPFDIIEKPPPPSSTFDKEILQEKFLAPQPSDMKFLVIPEKALHDPLVSQPNVLFLPDQVAEEKNARTVQPEEIVSERVQGSIKSGDTISSLLAPYASPSTIHKLITSTKEVYNLTRINPRQPYILEYTPDKELIRFTYEIDRNEFLIVSRKHDTFIAERKPIHYDIKLAQLSGTITTSFFEAFVALDEHASLAITLADIFSFEIDFIKDIRKGDMFTILVEKKFRGGKFNQYGRILAASFINNGDMYDAFYFILPSKESSVKYYTGKGESLQKMLLKSPLAFSRVTSGYSMNRLHPIYKKRRPHQAIDYAAPRGTPIKTVGDGIVTYVGRRGGYGKHVAIRHGGGFESMYSHLSRYGRGIKKGARVKQGQTIGAVGSTGVSTGPHLDFRLKRYGSYINPQKVVTPRVGPVPKEHMAAYLKQVSVLQEYLKNEQTLASYKPEQVL